MSPGPEASWGLSEGVVALRSCAGLRTCPGSSGQSWLKFLTHTLVIGPGHISQLFQIDTAGCMEVVRERKAQTPALLQTGSRDPPLGLLQVRSRG